MKHIQYHLQNGLWHEIELKLLRGAKSKSKGLLVDQVKQTIHTNLVTIPQAIPR